MPRARNIKHSFFTNDLLAETSAFARLLYAGLWTLADRNGNLEYRPRRIRAELFPYDDLDIEALTCELEERGFVRRYAVDGSEYLTVPTFVRHQKIDTREPARWPLAPDQEDSTKTAPKRTQDSDKEPSARIPNGTTTRKDSKRVIHNSKSAALNLESVKLKAESGIPPTDLSTGGDKSGTPASKSKEVNQIDLPDKSKSGQGFRSVGDVIAGGQVIPARRREPCLTQECTGTAPPGKDFCEECTE